MNIIAVDPGMTHLGLGAVQVIGDEISLITYGMIYHPRDLTAKFNEHLNSGINQISNDFPRFLDVTQPDLIVAELVPPGRLGSNSDLVRAAITTCKVIAFQFGITWIDLGANTVKKELTGNGKASKAKVKNVVFETFPIIKNRHNTLKKEQKADGVKVVGLPQDIFDAVGIAIVGAKLYGITNEGSEA